MAMFVHLAPESRADLIRRNGIRRLRNFDDNRPRGIFAVPVMRNFYISHQWLRELKRNGQRSIVGVYFRIPDRERVWVGHYRHEPREMSAAEAVAELMASGSPEGWEVLIPRGIEPSEIHRIRRLPQVVGWRYFPEAKGKEPFCRCAHCLKGDYGASKLRRG